MLTGRSYILSASATSAVPFDGYCAPQKTASICRCGSSSPASAYASYAASTIMSWGSLSQFSPNLQQPIPTMATLSRIASLFMRFPRRCARVRSAHRRDLPIVVRRAAGVVDLPEDELDGKVELHLLGIRVGHLDVEARAVDVGDGRDERRHRAAGEHVEGVGLHRADLVRQADVIELVLREALEADALVRVLRLAALPALLR